MLVGRQRQVFKQCLILRRFTHGTTAAAEEMVSNPAKKAGSSLYDYIKQRSNLFLAGAAGLVALNFAATKGYSWVYKRSVLNQLEEGLLPAAQPPAVLPRQSLQDELEGILRPEKPSRFYCILTGPHGSGKSTLVKQACRNAGSGVGYIDIHPAFDVDFGEDLGKAFNFRYEQHVTLLNIVTNAVVGRKMIDRGNKHPLSTLRQSAEALHDAAVEYKKKSGRPFVLVIDSVERLKGEKEEKALEALIEYAKDFAQEGVISIVFVTSSWDVVKKLAGDHPSSSRAAAPVVVGDLSLDEALQYMTYLEVPQPLASKLVELVGGSLLLVERAAVMFSKGADYATIKSRLMDLMELEYQAAGLLHMSPEQEAGLNAVQAMLAKDPKELSVGGWRQVVQEQEQQDALLKSGVFTSDGRKVTFTSRLAAIYATERLKDQVKFKGK